MCQQYQLAGITQDVTTCECCGRTNLKKTVVLWLLDSDTNKTGDVVHFGVNCAARSLRFGKGAKLSAREVEKGGINARWDELQGRRRLAWAV